MHIIFLHMPYVPERNPLTTDDGHHIFDGLTQISNGNAFDVFLPKTVTSSYILF